MKLGSPEAMRSEPSLSEPHDCAEDGHVMRVVKTARVRNYDGSSETVTLSRCIHCPEESLE